MDDQDRAAYGYPVGIVGEGHYQTTIGQCRKGDIVHIVHEQGNPYDPDALAALTARRELIGYIARDSWLRRAIVGEGHGCAATILAINRVPTGLLAVVLDVELNGWDICAVVHSQKATQTPVTAADRGGQASGIHDNVWTLGALAIILALMVAAMLL